MIDDIAVFLLLGGVIYFLYQIAMMLDNEEEDNEKGEN